ncbi:hypothetical protein PPN31114_03508 [Pandoraea pneumonica]|uniref:Peptidase S74 domain-containing protein n=1 Tax=Pandoraea pneumonica TaxID=2508299 RepID=A0A5E4WX02_9BURK|nr:tail fiber domain-containing protein [Pandoraea pneumonica]VVE28124.1 hypothetical protein PPN31114_03508 [Pandoraea pneumonica]
MAFDPIRLGSLPDGAGGDDARTGFSRTNNNFQETQRQLDAKMSSETAEAALAQKMPKNPGGSSSNFVMGDGTVGNAVKGYVQVKNDNWPAFEWHIPSVVARICFLSVDGSLSWVGSNGGGTANGGILMGLSSVGGLSILGTLTQGSDYRLKENVADLDPDDVLGRLLRLHLFEYDALLDPDHSRGPGVFAHELQEQFPHLVTGTKDAMRAADPAGGTDEMVPDYQRVNYSGLTVYLAAGVQAVVRRLKEAETRITDLTAAVDALSAAVNGTPSGDAS